MITSPHNNKLKEIRRLQRGRDERFVAEGEDLLAAAAAAGWSAAYELRAGVDVDPALLADVSGLGSGTRALGVFQQRWAPQPLGPVCVALWGVGDPGNVGTVLRTALAFGAGSVALGPHCADPFGPKAVRASMGAIFSVPVARVASVDELPTPRVALVPRTEEVLRGPVHAGTLVIGAEREGLPAGVVESCDVRAHIPIHSDSLNAAVAAAIGLYEWRAGAAAGLAPGDRVPAT